MVSSPVPERISLIRASSPVASDESGVQRGEEHDVERPQPREIFGDSFRENLTQLLGE